MPGEKYQITFTRFNTDKSGVAQHYTFNDDSLIKILTSLQIAIATVCKLEEDNAIHKSNLLNDEDIPF